MMCERMGQGLEQRPNGQLVNDIDGDFRRDTTESI